MKNEKVILRGVVTAESLSKLQSIYKGDLDQLTIIFENIDSVSAEVIEWLSEITSNPRVVVTIRVTRISLHGYLSAFKIPCELLRDKSNGLLLSPPIEAIAIGGSAGSNILIAEILKHTSKLQIPIFIVQHLSDEHHTSHLNLFQQTTHYDLSYPKNGEKIENNRVYLAPPNHHLRVENGIIYLDESQKVNFARPSISVLFESISNEYKSGVLAILTCGYGKDGSDVMKLLHSNKTPLLIHNPSECEAKPLVQNAINEGYFNHILTQKEILLVIEALSVSQNDENRAKERFLQAVHSIYGYDFREYNQKMIERRIMSIMLDLKIKDRAIFYRTVLLNSNFFKEFFLTVAINITEFFRKPHTILPLKEVLKTQFSTKDHIKVWIAGSSSGEEPYSIAFMLEDLGLLQKSMIYATDFNTLNITKSVNGIYDLDTILLGKRMASGVLENSSFDDYFEMKSNYGVVKPNIQKKVLFFEHNLVTDSGFNEFSIIICKNVLIYFEKVLQEKVIRLFYDSLPVGGYLQIGGAERLPSNCRDLFTLVDIKGRIYKKRDLDENI